MDIFKEHRLHPGYDKIIIEHYAEYFDTVFIAFSPFFKIQTLNSFNCSSQKSHEISFEELQQEIEGFRKISKPNASIFSYDNSGGYPTDEEIYEFAFPVSWHDIQVGCNFQNLGDINKALKTSIGAYKKVFERQDLVEQLSKYTEPNQIFYPTEGHFEILSKKEIFKAFRLFNNTEIIVEEEFYFNKKNKKIIDITSVTEKEFVDLISFKDYYIYDSGKELLFAVGWDDFFFLICSNKQNLNKIVDTLNFEGFYCNDLTDAAWEFTKQELSEGLAKEKQ